MTLSIKWIADQLNSLGFGESPSEKIVQALKDVNAIAAFGYSDDCLEIFGTIRHEFSAINGGTFRVPLTEDYGDGAEQRSVISVRADWHDSPLLAPEGVAWDIYPLEKNIQYETFIIQDDGEPFCRGSVIVFPPFENLNGTSS